MTTVADAIPGEEIHELRGEHADDDIGTADEGIAERGIIDVEAQGLAAGMTADALLREVEVQVADGDEPVVLLGLVEEVADEVGCALAGAENDDLLHGVVSG